LIKGYESSQLLKNNDVQRIIYNKYGNIILKNKQTRNY